MPTLVEPVTSNVAALTLVRAVTLSTSTLPFSSIDAAVSPTIKPFEKVTVSLAVSGISLRKWVASDFEAEKTFLFDGGVLSLVPMIYTPLPPPL